MTQPDFMARDAGARVSASPAHRLAHAKLRKQLHRAAQMIVSPIGILCCSVLLWLGTLGIGVAMLMASRTDAFDHAVQNARNLTLVLERDIQRSVDMYDLSLRAVAEGAVDSRVMALPLKVRNQVLFDRAATAPFLGAITVRTTNGTLLADSSDGWTGQVRVHTTPAFDNYLHATGDLYIGHPLPSTPRRAPCAIPLVRPMRDANGAISGTVVGSLSLEYFRALTNGLAIGENGSVAVIETDGTLIARLPNASGNIGRSFAHEPVFERLASGHEGYFVGTPLIDGIRRLYVYKRLAGLPLIVTVAPAISTIYADWWAKVEWFAALMLIFSIIKASGTWLFVRELHRRQRAEAELERMAHQDALTGLENRGRFDDVLAREWKRSKRSGKPLSLLFIDIDKFKAYNDHYGHQAGDAVLKTVAARISSCVERPGDHVARYGGEEFVVVLPDTPTEGARLLGEKIRLGILDLQVEHSQTPIGYVTVSVGVSSTELPMISDAALLVQSADTALYEAKETGRNRVATGRHFDGATSLPDSCGAERGTTHV